MRKFGLSVAILSALLVAGHAFGALNLGAEQLVQAGGVDIAVPGYSVPSFVNWNNDGLPDLVVGEGGGSVTGKVRVYLNAGTAGHPQFSTPLYAQSGLGDLTVPPSGCLGAFPRLVDWGSTAQKNLLIGQADGKVKFFLNTGSISAPAFDAGTFVQVGQPGSKTDIDVGDRATPTIVDWNADGVNDLVVGGLDGKIHVFANVGTDAAPDFRVQTLAQANSADLVVPMVRSSPVIMDLDGDGKKDILTGDTEGQLLLYSNTGTNQAPSFSGYTAITADGVAINLPGTLRSRPFVCDWTGDGLLDVLIGYGDTNGGKVHLYQGVPEPASLSLLALGGLALLRRR